jgi:Ca2+-binding EF-hand superfamily protein
MIAKLQPKVTEQKIGADKREEKRSLRAKRKRIIERLGKGMDTNNDGVISKEELVDYVLLLEDRIELLEELVKRKLTNE